MPLFSIVTVTKDNLAGLVATHKSLLVQAEKDFEWIVIDGGSQDGTKDFLNKADVEYISEPDNGIYDGMNKGIERAKGSYVIFMNAGDAFADETVLHNLGQTITEHTPAFIYGDSLESIKGKTPYKKARKHHLRHGMFTHHQAMVYKTKIIDDLRYDTTYGIAADYDFTLKFLSRTNRIHYFDHPICIFESGGVSQQKAWQGRKEQFIIRAKHKFPRGQNIRVYVLQTANYFLRKYCPKLYWLSKRS